MKDAYHAMQECERFVNPYCVLARNGDPCPDDIMEKHKSDQRCLVVEIIRRHILEDENPIVRMGAFDWREHIVYQEDFGPSFNPAWIVSHDIERCAQNMGVFSWHWGSTLALRGRSNHDWPATHGTRDAAFDQLLRRTIFFDVD